MNTVPLRNEASLVACKRVLAKLYNTTKSLTLSERIEILEALGYGYLPEEVGALLAGMAKLTDDGIIQHHDAVAAPDWTIDGKTGI